MFEYFSMCSRCKKWLTISDSRITVVVKDKKEHYCGKECKENNFNIQTNDKIRQAIVV
jgi:hypothetical protein